MLADVRDKLVRSVTLIADVERISQALINDLEKYTVGEHGKTLKFLVRDPESQISVKLFSRKKQVELTDDFLKFLTDNNNLEFRLS